MAARPHCFYIRESMCVVIVGAFGFSLLRGLVATSQRPGGEGRQVREVIEVDLVCPAFLLLSFNFFFFVSLPFMYFVISGYLITSRTPRPVLCSE